MASKYAARLGVYMVVERSSIFLSILSDSILGRCRAVALLQNVMVDVFGE